MRGIKKIIAVVCAAAMTVGMITFNPIDVDAAKAPKLNKKKVSVNVGGTYKIKLKNGAKKAKVTWKSSKKKVVRITKKSNKGKKAYAKFKKKKKGKAKVSAIYKLGKIKKKLVCNVTVKGRKTVEIPGNTATNPPAVSSPVVNSGESPTPSQGDNHTGTPDNPQSEPITLYNEKMVAPVIMDSGYNNTSENQYAERSYEQIYRAVRDLRQDISMVTGAIDYAEIQSIFDDNADEEQARIDDADSMEPKKVPDLVTDTAGISADSAIIIGTIDDSTIIKKLMDEGKLEEAKQIKGVWEGYVIKQVKNAIPGVDNALVIAGSDARGTIYGIYTVSESIGVSPYYWYSDVPVEVKDTITFDAKEAIVNDGPDVKYRGIFINDEEKSNAWAESKFTEDGKNGPGVNYYRRVFELVLRLKANTLWPAMHGCSVAFNKNVDENGISINAQEAAGYGIIMGASHCEILLRNNVGEWGDWFNANKSRFENISYPNDSYKAYDFTLNREMLLEYWRERLTANKDFESILTVGVRGPHDEAFNCENLSMYPGNTDAERKVSMMEDVITSQREIIADIYGEENVQKIPQVFIPYKEMNDVYNAGLDEFMLWDGSEDFNGDGITDYRDDNTDIMLMWAEDNENYIRQDLSEEEAGRAGGAGIYYHISYWGPPASFLWLNSTSLYTMSEQMHRGYDIGADDYWILNVGDIKPSEPSMEFFLKMAWDSRYWDDTTVIEFLKNQAKRDYGMNDEDAAVMASAVSEYYAINGTRKAEFYEKPDYGSLPTEFCTSGCGDESMLWIERINKVVDTMEGLYNKLSDEYKDAFYEHFYYNTTALRDIIENTVYYNKNQLAAAQGRVGSANVYAELSKAAAARVKEGLKTFNSTHNNKWTNFMDCYHPGRGDVLIGDAGEKYGEVKDISEGVGAACENSTKAGIGTLRFNSLIEDEIHYFDVFDVNTIEEKWVAEASADWIKLSKTSGSTRTEERVIVSIDQSRISKTESGTISVYNADASGNKEGTAVATFAVEAVKSNVTYGDNKGYIEANGYVKIEAEHYSEIIEGKDGSYFGVIKSAGQVSDAMKALPDTAKVTTDWDSAAKLVYRVYFENAGTYSLSLRRRPVLNEGKEDGVDRTMNIAVGVGDYEPTVLKGKRAGDWNVVLNMCEILKCNITVKKGWNDIIVYRSDASFVWDNMYIETVKGAVPTSVLWPAESPNNIAEAEKPAVGKLPLELGSYNPGAEIVMDNLRNMAMNENDVKTVNFSVYATNGKPVTVTAKSSNEQCVSVFVNDGKITLTAKEKSGNVSVIITAKAEGCDELKKEFRVTVRDSSIGSLYIEKDGEVVINAADALLQGGYSWTEVSEPDVWVASDDKNGIKHTPDTGRKWEADSNIDEAPSINFKVKISKAGTYYLFTNMSNPNNNADSYHVLVDGVYKYTHNSGDMSGKMIWRSAGKGLALSAGEHTITIAAREDGLVVNQMCLTMTKDKTLKDGILLVFGDDPAPTPTTAPTSNPPVKGGAYIENEGKIVINAADATENTIYASFTGASDGEHSWEIEDKGIQVTPDTGKNWTKGTWDDLNGNAPMLKYKVDITNDGNYYLFVNMSNPNNAGDSYFVAVDGGYKYIAVLSGGEQLGNETWYSEKKAINLSAGEHEIIIFAREDGLLINQILLSNDKEIALDGLQPVSERKKL